MNAKIPNQNQYEHQWQQNLSKKKLKLNEKLLFKIDSKIDGDLILF